MTNTHFLDYNGLVKVWDKVKERDSEITQVFGYFMNQKFYKDSTYQEELEKSTKHIYIDKNSGQDDKATGIYYYDGESYCRAIQLADDSIPGILKLYKTHGDNEDGTMTQKAITNGVAAIKFGLDDEQDECLILDLPWTGV